MDLFSILALPHKLPPPYFNTGFYLGKIFFVVELIIAELIFLFPAKRRKCFAVRLIVSAALSILLAAFFPRVIKENTNYIFYTIAQLSTSLFLFFITILAMGNCFKMKVRSLVAMCCAGYAVQHFNYNATQIVVGLLPPIECSFLTSARIYELIVNIFLFIVFFLTLGLYSARNECYRNQDSRFSFVAIVILFLCLVISRFRIFFDEEISLTNRIYAMFCCLLTLYILFLLHHAVHLAREKAVIQKMNEEQVKQYHISKMAMEMIHIKYHDLKHIYEHPTLYERGVDEINRNLQNFSCIFYTGNEVLNTILTEKSLLSMEKGIRITFAGSGQELKFMETMDIYALFGNAIDNAIEAVEQLTTDTKKEIGIALEKHNHMLVLTFTNYCMSQLKKRNGMLKTSKPGGDLYHGYGVKSMQLIAQKYGGDLSYRLDGEIFTLTVYVMNDRSTTEEDLAAIVENNMHSKD